ncbi:MAG: DUF4129 domain-containing protein [Mycobacterium sp.]
MPPRERTRRIASATALVALSIVAATALRGHLPGVEPGPSERAAENPLALTVVVVLLGAAVGVVAVAVIARLRNRTTAAPRVSGRSDWLRGGDRGRPTWRVALIAFGLILGWLLLAMLLGGLGGGDPEGTTAPGAAPTAADPTPDPQPPAGEMRRPEPEPEKGSDLLGYFYGATVIFLFVIVAGSVVAGRKQRVLGIPAPTGEDAAPESETRSESLARAAEVGLAEVGDLSREPRKAIIACYAAMERELALLPDAAPREFDTASEVLARAVDHHAIAPDSATQLVDLFDEARFSPHVMDEGHRDVAVAVLTQVLGELRSRA